MNLIIFVMMFYLMDLGDFNLYIPMQYEGGDDMGVLVNAKQFTEQGWNMTSDRLGAPYTVQYYDFTASMMHNVGLFIMKIFAVIIGNAAAAMNLTYLSIYFMAGIISYFVMRSMKINCWINALTSSVFALSPYMLYRNIGHIVLTECYFVPLSILICLWIYERDDVLVPDRNFFKRKINYVVLFFTFLIANNGIAYYPFFTCFMACIANDLSDAELLKALYMSCKDVFNREDMKFISKLVLNKDALLIDGKKLDEAEFNLHWQKVGYCDYRVVIIHFIKGNLGNFTSLSQLLPDGATEKIKSQIEKKLLTLFTNLNAQLSK